MKTTPTTTLLLALAATLAGCGLPTLKGVDPQALTAEQAVIVVSTGAGDACRTGTAGASMKTADSTPSLYTNTADLPLNNGFMSSDVPGEHAKVFSFIVKPGTYDFWLNNTNPQATYGNPLITEPFQVAAREVLYLGEIWSLGCGAGRLHLEIRDRRARDLGFVRTTNPKVANGPVAVRLLRKKGGLP